MNKNLIYLELKNICKNILVDELMSKHTSFKVGGPADFVVIPDSIDELIKIKKFCNTNNIEYFVIGNGTNIIVRDKGFRGIIIKISDKFSNVNVNKTRIEAFAGVKLSKLCEIALENSLTGLEFAYGIPGVVGGAVAMNAGAYDGEMKNIVYMTEYLDSNGNVKRLFGEENQFEYRNSYIQKNRGIVIRSIFELKHGDYNQIKLKMDDLTEKRWTKQPMDLPSAGSVFKRPEGHYTGKLVEECDLRGYRIGGAQVSDKHCGFIVNVDNANAKDVIDLIEKVKVSVLNKFGVVLNTEVKIIGQE